MPQTITIGARGADVSLLQTRLNAKAPTAFPLLIVDGRFGPLTLRRVKEFQTNNGLLVDGVVGPITWGKVLEEEPCQRETFYTEGRFLYDRCGNKVVLRGVNKMSVWDGEDPAGTLSFPEIGKTGANSVRVVWQTATAEGPTDIAVLDALIANAKQNRLVPMVELHDATGAWAGLQALVDYWTRPEVVAVIHKHRSYLLVNIGNEVGDETVTEQQFLDGYTDAVARMRGAGIDTPLVIDAADWGKNIAMLNATAQALQARDPQHNLLFSVHLYWSMSCGADAAFIRAQLQQAVDVGYPLIVGEFSQYGGYPCGNPGGGMCSPGGEIDYRTIIEECQKHQIGWYAWEWGPGNEYNDPLCAVMNMTTDRLFINLQPGWATEVAVSSPFSIKNTSIIPPTM